MDTIFEIERLQEIGEMEDFFSRVFLLRSNMDRQLLHQKSRRKLSVKKKWCFQNNSFFWHFNSQHAKTPVFMFSLLRFFD